MEKQIQIHNLTKEFDHVPVLKNISFSVQKGEIVGLLGKNGSGKTTLLKLLAGLLIPTDGDISVLCQNPQTDREQVLPLLGVMIENPVFYEHLDAYENLSIHLDYMGVSTDIDAVLKSVGLIGVKNKPVSKFSLGMKQKLAIARSISHKPQILFLDEPINGLDPVATQDIRNLFLSLKNNGTTIILSSHILSELLLTAESIMVISNKNLEHLGSISNLKQQHGNNLENFLIERMCI